MYAIKTDKQKNRLYIMVDGTIAINSIDAYNEEIRKAVSSLKAGFTALLDLRKTSVFDQESMKQLQGTKDIAVKAGLKKSAMVVESATLKMQMNRNYKEVGPQDKAFNEVDEAESFLDE